MEEMVVSGVKKKHNNKLNVSLVKLSKLLKNFTTIVKKMLKNRKLKLSSR